jgi:hypothetical protein
MYERMNEILISQFDGWAMALNRIGIEHHSFGLRRWRAHHHFDKPTNDKPGSKLCIETLNIFEPEFTFEMLIVQVVTVGVSEFPGSFKDVVAHKYLPSELEMMTLSCDAQCASMRTHFSHARKNLTLYFCHYCVDTINAASVIDIGHAGIHSRQIEFQPNNILNGDIAEIAVFEKFIDPL